MDGIELSTVDDAIIEDTIHCTVCCAPFMCDSPHVCIDPLYPHNPGTMQVKLCPECASRAVADWDEWQERSLLQILRKLIDDLQPNDSYGVHGSDFRTCNGCGTGGAPLAPYEHDEHCPVGVAEKHLAECLGENEKP